MKRDERRAGRIPVVTPSMPKAGGAIRGLGETMRSNLFSGAAEFSVPIPVPDARGFQPDLALTYGSGDGNGPFGLGVSVSMPSIARRTSKGFPRYDDTDVFVWAGDTLVPVPGDRTRTVGATTYAVTRYLCREEHTFDRVERYVPIQDDCPVPSAAFWRVIHRDNVIQIYGRKLETRVSDPGDATRVYAWLLEDEFDAKGHRRSYQYKQEDYATTDQSPVFERGRTHTAMRYLERICYGNREPVATADGGLSGLPDSHWLFETVFDYGEYDPRPTNDHPYQPRGPWRERQDPFSLYDAGFERRTHRLCRNVLTFHRFEPELGTDPVLTHVVRLVYNEQPHLTTLARVDSVGYRLDPSRPPGQRYVTRALPPIEFEYAPFTPLAETFRPMQGADGRELVGVDGDGFTLVDLEGQGVPGILYADGATVLYRAPVQAPAGAAVPIQYSTAAAPRSFPSERVTDSGDVILVDATGDGRVDLLRTAAPIGLYENSGDGEWQPLATLANFPSDFRAASRDLTDMTGAGLLDVVTIDDAGVTIYPSRGRDGYAPATVTARENRVAVSAPETPARVLRFDDLIGAGGHQRVLIEDGTVRYWPHLGYGRYGPPVQMQAAFAFARDMNAGRIRFADLDGSGTQDLIYIATDHVDIYINRGGNSFASEPLTIALPSPCGSPDQVMFADVSGGGYACLVFKEDAPIPRHWCYDFCQGRKPHLLVGVRNNTGGQTSITYSTSSQFYLQDHRQSRPWITPLPFPVHVVASIEQVDLVARTTHITSYAYHHGFYDGIERDFRGFGMVESSETQLSSAPDALPSCAPSLTRTWYHTGVWGSMERDLLAAYVSEQFTGDPLAAPAPEVYFENLGDDPDAETWRQAHVALAGTVLREEIYGLEDGPANLGTPFQVSVHGVQVRLVQAIGTTPYAVFLTSDRENISYHYDAQSTIDPRVAHDMTLNIDIYGDVTESCSIAYPRRDDATAVPLATADWTTYVPPRDHDDDLLLGIVSEARAFEINDWPAPDIGGRYFSPRLAAQQADRALTDPAAGRLIAWHRSHYQPDPDPLSASGAIAPQALLISEESASHSVSQLQNVFASSPLADRVTTCLQSGGYVLDAASGYWWAQGSTVTYFSATDMKFFAPCEVATPFGAKTRPVYDDYTLLLRGSVRTCAGVLDATAAVETLDYQALQGVRVIDPNGNVSEAVIDPLGLVIAQSTYKPGSPPPWGFTPVDRYQPIADPSLDTIVASPAAFLQGAGTFFFADFLAWTGRLQLADLSSFGDDAPGLLATLIDVGCVTPEGAILDAFWSQSRDAFVLPAPYQDRAEAVYDVIAARPHRSPASGVTLVGESYPELPNPDRPGGAIQVLVAYSDGSNRIVQSSSRVEDGIAVLCDEHGVPILNPDGTVKTGMTTNRWLVSGRTRYNDLGEPIQQFEPYYIETYRFTDVPALSTFGVSSTLHYDAVGRAVQVDQPKGPLRDHGVFEKTVYEPWRIAHYDVNDTIADSPYYQMTQGPNPPPLSPADKDALNKALALKDTPSIAVLDCLGNVVQQMAYRDPATIITTVITRDIEGREVTSADPRLREQGLTNVERIYAIGGAEICTRSVDAGTRLSLFDVAGQPLCTVDGRGFVVSNTYDGLRRRLTTLVEGGDGVQPLHHLTERVIYGDTLDASGQPPIPNPQRQNLCGALFRQYHPAGMIGYDGYDLQGGPRVTRQRLRADYQNEANWIGDPESSLDPIEYVTTARFDALGRVVEWVDLVGDEPSGYTQTRSYLLSGPIDEATLDGRTYFSGASYNARGQLEHASFGNGVTSGREYEPDTFRLKRCIATRASDQHVVQDLTFTYDPVGNVTHVQDQAAPFQQVFNRNAAVSPDQDFTYDTLYQLKASSGRAHTGLTAAIERRGDYAPFFPSGRAPLNDGSALENYTRSYNYDAGGNLYEVSHVSPSVQWTRTLTVDAGSNRAVEHDDDTPRDVGSCFDVSGNLIKMTGLAPIAWNYRNNLRAVTLVQRPGAASDGEYYVYDGGGARRRRVTATLQNGAVAIAETRYLGSLEIYRRSIGDRVIEERRRIRVASDHGAVAERVEWIVAPASEQPEDRYRLENHQGSSVLELDDQGALTSYEEYAPYGGTMFAAGTSLTAVTRKAQRYAGQERDQQTGLYYYGFRYYAPWLGRWISADPAGDVDGLNLYAFVNGNPASDTDIGGLGKQAKPKNGQKAQRQTNAPPKKPTKAQKMVQQRQKPGKPKPYIPLIANAAGTGRPLRKTRFAGDYKKMLQHARKGVSKNPNVQYPDRAIHVMEGRNSYPQAQALAARYKRKQPAQYRHTYIDDALSRPARFRTGEDKEMIAHPDQNMVNAKISLNHRLADSSVMALMVAIWHVLREQFQTHQRKAQVKFVVDQFIGAMVSSAEERQTVWDSLTAATSLDDVRAVMKELSKGIDTLSLAKKNIRFGNAKNNTWILYAFDPNLEAGNMTPRSKGIFEAVSALKSIIDADVIDACLTRAVNIKTGQVFGSSVVGAKTAPEFQEDDAA